MAGESRPRVAHHCDSSLAPSDRAAAIIFNLNVLGGLSMVLTAILKNKSYQSCDTDPQPRDGAWAASNASPMPTR
jgi:hypothetical protein